MTISMYQASVPVFLKMLGNLRSFIVKGETYAQEHSIEPAALLNARLFPNMLPLIKQVQIASDSSKGCVARLAGVDVPKFEDNETSFDDVKARIDKTMDFLKTFRPEQIDGTEERDIAIPVAKEVMHFTGQQYLLNFAMPNFYFHVTTTYALLRHNGVALGKRDFLA